MIQRLKTFEEFAQEVRPCVVEALSKKTLVGVKETITIKEFGDLKAKLDSGNSAMNAIIVKDYTVEDGFVVFTMHGDEYKLPIVGTKKIYHHGNLTERPVIELTVTFLGKTYENEKFSVKINDLHNLSTHARVLLSKDFLSAANVLIDPSSDFYATTKTKVKKKKKSKVKPVSESIHDDIEKVETDKYLLSNSDKEYLIQLDREYGKLALLFRQTYRAKNVTNIDEEFDKFISAKREGKKYFPKLKLEKRESDIDMLALASELKTKFENFNSYISQFYIDKLHSFIVSINKQRKYAEEIKEEDYEKPVSTKHGGSFPTDAEYEHAMGVIAENPYEKVYFDKRNIPAKEAAKQIQQYIDKKGYEFEVKLVPNMLPRMNVTPDAIVRVNPDAHFSEEDIEGLCQHEIEGHVGRRYYGYKTGLMLFIFGLIESNTYDEGLAIWNSLNRVETPKPNILFNIALKTVITYHLYDKDFCELFDFIKEIQPNMSDKTIFKSIIRMKRGVIDCHLYGGALESGYFAGYNYVSQMSDEERDDILKYNIGPKQLKDLNGIKKFLEINKFNPIKIDALKKYNEK